LKSGVDLVAVYNRTVSKAEAIAQRFGVPRVYGDPEELLKNEQLDFIDIITEVPFHAPLVYQRRSISCRSSAKPMAPDLETAEKMVQACRDAACHTSFMKTFVGRHRCAPSNRRWTADKSGHRFARASISSRAFRFLPISPS
jgi:predicted dehydrogenase